MYKVIVFIPKENKEEVKEAMFRAGAGHIGNYDKCSFETEGVGQFRPLKGSNPTLGSQDKVEKVVEVKVEVAVRDEKIHDVLRAMKEAHPYEEVAFDVFKHVEITL